MTCFKTKHALTLRSCRTGTIILLGWPPAFTHGWRIRRHARPGLGVGFQLGPLLIVHP